MTRDIAHIIIQAHTPLKVGSNGSDFLQDAPIQKDFNNLPMILGTSIAGVLRKDFNTSKVQDIFGKDNGSKVIISNALLLDESNKVNEELLLKKSDFLKIFDNLPIREHTAITHKGVAKEHSKFDEEVVYKGTKFKFSIELIEDDKDSFQELLELLSSPSFRLGGGSTKGFGKFKILEIRKENFDETNYQNYSSSLNHILKDEYTINSINSKTHTKYTLKITPDDFFLFGSGFGDNEADMTPVYEKVVDYKKGELSEKMILIPASSIKGAIAHRVAYYYNLSQNHFIGEDKAKIGEENEAVKAIFGHKKEEDTNTKKELGQKGKILLSDCFETLKENQTKVFDHVAIDRFTGGGIDGALFQEKTIADDREYSIEILLENDIDEVYIKAFESSLDDICSGMLPLGGATTKGHGVFSGSWSKK